MADLNRSQVAVGSLRLNVTDWGSLGKPPLILVHGLASSSHMFDLVAPLLTTHYHVIAYDQRGHGQSDKPDGGYDFESIAADLDGLANALGFANQSLTIAGHSWGASTALYYAATRPNRVRNAILIDGALRPVRAHFASLDSMAPPQRANWPLDAVKRMIRENWLGPAWRPELEPLVLSIYDLSNPADVRPHLKLANHMQIAAALWDFQPNAFYALARCPLLSINAVRSGLPDAQMRAYFAEAQRLSRDLECVWMLDSIHDVPWQRPQALANVMLDWLLSNGRN